MNMILKSLTLEQFKGVADAKTFYFFAPKTEVIGKNGVGKTTLMSAFYWLFCDRDAELKSNPFVAPIGVAEANPKVEAVVVLNDKIVTFCKIQKRKVSKPDENGVSKVSLANTYMINDVPKTERDFMSYLEENDINMELFLPLSHTESFVGKKADDMRKILFKMVGEDFSDWEISLKYPEMHDLQRLLADYKVEEIEAMQKASKKKADELIASIPNQIIGLEKAKVDYDSAELELQKNAILEQISDQQKKLDDLKDVGKDLADEIFKMKMELSALKMKLNQDVQQTLREARRLRDDKMTELSDMERIVKNNNIDLSHRKNRLESLLTEIEDVKKKYHEIMEMRFNENSNLCFACGQELPETVKDKNKMDFETKRAEQMKKIAITGNSMKAEIDKTKEEILKFEEKIEEDNAKLELLKNEYEELSKQYDALPTEYDYSSNEEYQNLANSIVSHETELEKIQNVSDAKILLTQEIDNNRRELEFVNHELSLVENNTVIDEKIEKLNADKFELEQAKANAEKILYQVDLLSHKKNELLTEIINSHFSVVNWKLFDYQKNGGYKECCIPQYKGKDLSVSTNTGLELIMKIDICNSLQKYFELNLPIFVDKMESLDQKNEPDVSCQMILLRRTDNNEISTKGKS